MVSTPVARERVENEILRSVGVDGAEPDGEHELGRFERDLKWPQGVEPEPRLLFQVDLGDEEANVLADVAREHARCAWRCAVAVLFEPRLQSIGLFRGEDDDVVLAHDVLRFDVHAEGIGARSFPGHAARSWCPVSRREVVFLDAHARVTIEVLDETRRRERIEMIDERIVGHMDLLSLDERRYGNHHRELFRLASKVVDHGDDGLVAVPDENDLRRLVEELDICFRDVEAAKGSDGWPRPHESAGERCPEQCHGTFHAKLLSENVSAGVAEGACHW